MNSFIATLALIGLGVLPAHSQNLLLNGDFELGNTQFTSDYHRDRLDSGVGTFNIVHRPIDTHFLGASFGDHTTSAGLMLVANGSPNTNAVVWRQTVPISQNNLYNLSGWATLIGTSHGQPTNDNISRLSASINGSPILPSFDVPNPSGAWQRFTASWNSRGATNALIEIRDLIAEASGNDFALDDLSFESLSPENCLAPPANLVGWWPGDVYTNDLASDHGIVLESATYAPGKIGDAFQFTSTNSYGRVPFNPTLAALTNTLTLECWAWLTRTDGIRRFMTVTPDNVVLESRDGQLTFSLALAPNNASAQHTLTATNTLSTNSWHHLAATYDGTTQSLYLDGDLVAIATVGPPLVPIGQGAAPEVYISFLGNQSLDGLIDEPAIYNRGLTSSEVESHFAAGSAGMCKRPRLTELAVFFPGTARMTIKGQPVMKLEVQHSKNFVDWFSLVTLTNFSGRFQVFDLQAGQDEWRFYRALAP